ncbi:MAG TPA: oligopeptide:H+ symporter [Blastococcus sp.]|nr:oligopeptide:H+ symporter [Blastococcus sp.]
MSRTSEAHLADRTFFGQPQAMANLFGVEMWERFSFYGMQGILLIYLYYSAARGGLGIDQSEATSIVGAYGGLVYLSTVLGAWLADRVLGAEATLFASAVVVMCGHIALSVLPGLLGVGVGLVLIALGSGGVKATATTLVGMLYAREDGRREAGFALYYLGINLGGLVGPLLTGLVQTSLGFRAGFGLAAVGMAFGLAQYSVGRRKFSASAREVPSPLPADQRWPVVALVGAALVAIGLLFLLGVLTPGRLAGAVVVATIVATVAYFTVILTSRRITRVERRRVLAFVPMFLASAAFWSLYQQQFTVLTIYADTQLDRSILGWEMPVAWIQAVNPVFIILLSGAFAGLWTALGPRQPSSPVKFALATAVMGVGFLLFLPIAGDGPNSAPLMGVIGILFVFTVAELLLSPVGLALSTKLAPQAFRSQMVALFFLSIALGSALSGVLAGYFDTSDESPYFAILGTVAVVLGVLLAAAAPYLHRMMAGADGPVTAPR